MLNTAPRAGALHEKEAQEERGRCSAFRSRRRGITGNSRALKRALRRRALKRALRRRNTVFKEYRV